jgi:hypothetical protein
VSLVIGRGYILEVVVSVVGANAILVVYFVALWTRTNEGGGDKDVHLEVLLLPIPEEADGRSPLLAAPVLLENAASVRRVSWRRPSDATEV